MWSKYISANSIRALMELVQAITESNLLLYNMLLLYFFVVKILLTRDFSRFSILIPARQLSEKRRLGFPRNLKILCPLILTLACVYCCLFLKYMYVNVRIYFFLSICIYFQLPRLFFLLLLGLFLFVCFISVIFQFLMSNICWSEYCNYKKWQ